MKKLRYLSLMAILFGALATSCTDEVVRPTEEDEDDPIIIELPPPSSSDYSKDSLDGS